MAGVSNTDWSWTPLLADFDNDGWKDLLITNGYRRNYINMDFLKYTYEDAKQKAKQEGTKVNLMELVNNIKGIDIPNYIYSNNKNLTFQDRTIDWGMNINSFSGGAACADLDSDGDLDLVMNNINAPAFVYRNNNITGSRYLAIHFEGSNKNQFGIGCKAELKSESGTQVEALNLSRGYESSVEPELFFGTGKDEVIKEVKVIWPDGKAEVRKNIKTNQRISFNYSEAKPSAGTQNLAGKKKFENAGHEIEFTHIENDFVDFKTEPLIPHKLSVFGPRMATGDINGDGLTDLFIGNGAGSKAEIQVQTRDGKFIHSEQAAIAADSMCEEGESVFIDIDNDGDNDLYVVSGGYEFESDSPLLQDRLYINDGKGSFSKAKNAIPSDTIAGLCVKKADFDSDGDDDLFIGGCVQHAHYGLPVPSKLFRNDKGILHDVTTELCPSLNQAGMVMDAEFSDVNGDGKQDLIITGEWMKIRVFVNTGTGFSENTSAVPNSTGWWNCVIASDLDNDGDYDLIAGNRGSNEQMKATEEHPAYLYVKDFDNNHSTEPIITYFIKDGTYPMPSRDELLDQMVSMRKRYIYYHQYANQTIDSLFTPAQLSGAHIDTCVEMRSCWFENDGKGIFSKHPFSNEVQIAPINSIIATDVDGDGKTDLLMAGNNYSVRAEMGREDAGFGYYLKNDGKGIFSVIPAMQSGLMIKGDCRELKLITLGNKSTILVAGMNNDKLQTIKLNKK
jgi:hypothetical protein